MGSDATAYLTGKVLSMKKREQPEEMDSFSKALLVDNALGAIVRSAHSGQTAKNQEQLGKVLRLWGDRSIYPLPVVNNLLAAVSSDDGGTSFPVVRH